MTLRLAGEPQYHVQTASRSSGRRSARLQMLDSVIRLIGFQWIWLLPALALGVELEPKQTRSLERIEVFPSRVTLVGPRDQVRCVVTGHYSDGSLQDLTRVAELTAADAGVVQVNGAVLQPLRDDRTTVRVVVAGQQASIPVQVRELKRGTPVSFRHDVLAALSKQGCNSGACHGAPSGKGGFRLSLRAFDPELDQWTLIRESFGRRASPLEPGLSLLLLKPMMRVPHGGGLQLRRQDIAYRILRDWIAGGCRVDPPGSPSCVGIEVYPSSGRLLKHPAHSQQLSVMAHFSDDRVRDVTSLAVFSSSDDAVAAVDRTGLVVGKDRGEAAIIVRYLEFIESCSITFVRDIDGFAWNDPRQHNYIDRFVDQKLKQLQYLPSKLCDDSEFLRRAHLDVIGVLPTVAEVEAFLKDKNPEKRSQLIDKLLDRHEFANFWALKWGDLLRLSSKQVGKDGVYKYHRWVHRAMAENLPSDEFARQLLTATGSTHSNPAANFFRTATDTNDCVETVSQLFLGARLQCAKCHNHPFERWTQDNYYGMAAFFNRVRREKTDRPDELFVWVAGRGEVTQPRTGAKMIPWLPGDSAVQVGRTNDRRQLFAEWLTHPDNPFFARVEVNRIWSHLFGRGIVEPPDDFRDSNPPSNAALLDALARDFAQHGFDRKRLLRTILNSRTYQASFESNEFNRDDVKYFSHYQPRLLAAEQLLDAICHVTGVPEKFASLPEGTKATQLPAPDLVNHEFLKVFGQPQRQTVCECERSSDSNLGMAIQFFNGALISNKLRSGVNRFRRLVATGKTDEEIIGELHLAAVSRAPTGAELQAGLQHIAVKHQQWQAENAELRKKLKSIEQVIDKVNRQTRQQLLDEKLALVPEVLRHDLRQALQRADGRRDEVQAYLVSKLGPLVEVSDQEVDRALDDMDRKTLQSKTAERNVLAKQLKPRHASRLEALEDICWAILNTNEFMFQH